MRVSIHAPREGCDDRFGVFALETGLFQFTHPGRGATWRVNKDVGGVKFQFTHPGRGATVRALTPRALEVKFQFTHPGRGATGDRLQKPREAGFQFTHPGRGATTEEVETGDTTIVSIHAPREGCDPLRLSLDTSLSVFQFTHPGRGATPVVIETTKPEKCFNSRTPGGVRRVSSTTLIVQLIL